MKKDNEIHVSFLGIILGAAIALGIFLMTLPFVPATQACFIDIEGGCIALSHVYGVIIAIVGALVGNEILRE